MKKSIFAAGISLALQIERERWSQDSYDMAIGSIPKRFYPTRKSLLGELDMGLRQALAALPT